MAGAERTASGKIDARVEELDDWRGETLSRLRALIKLTFFKGASLDDPAGLFNSSLEGKVPRAIDVREGESIDADAFKALIRSAVALNRS